MSVKVGDRAPDFTLPTDGNASVSLAKLRGKPVVLYFYPKDDTSGCTAEACGFRDSFPDYGKTGAVVVSNDRATPEYLGGFIKSEIEKWAAPIKASGESVDCCGT